MNYCVKTEIDLFCQKELFSNSVFFSFDILFILEKDNNSGELRMLTPVLTWRQACEKSVGDGVFGAGQPRWSVDSLMQWARLCFQRAECVQLVREQWGRGQFLRLALNLKKRC